MNPLDIEQVENFVNENIGTFHERRINSLQNLELSRLIKKNPDLCRAKAITTAQDLIEGLLEAFLSSSEEEIFGEFLEDLAIHVAELTSDGKKSASEGVDLEFIRDGTHFIVGIKSGTNWGNSSQQRRLERNLREAEKRVKQSRRGFNVQSVLGICYGKTKTTHTSRGYLKIVGQEFWNFISGDENLYMDIIEPIGYRAGEHNEDFTTSKVFAINRLTKLFFNEYCDDEGMILWKRLVFINSGNIPKEKLPYGYNYDYDGIKVDQEQEKIVKKIFELSATLQPNGRRTSDKRIAELLNEEGHTNHVGNKWNGSNVSKIIKWDEKYSGGVVNDNDELPIILNL